jgi:uncharacterized protein (DUF934 family)
MRQIIKDGRIVRDDWIHLADDEAIPAQPIIVSLARWRRERETLLARPEKTGVRLHNDEDPRALMQDLAHWPVVALEFPGFTDGRAYSQAHLLRRCGYRGEIRAVGNVLRDQLLFMRRTGFDAFELQESQDLENALEAFREFTVAYQP